MPTWTRLTPPASGAFDKHYVTRAGGLLLAVLMIVFYLWQQFFSTPAVEPEPIAATEAPAGPQAAAALGARVDDLEQRAAMQRRADAAGQTLDQLGGAQVTPAYNPTTGAPLDPALAGPGIVTASQAEADLREQLRLEAIERQSRSIRSEPVAISYRTPAGDSPAATADAGAPVASSGSAGSPDASTPLPAGPAPATFLDTLTALQALDQQVPAGGTAFDAGPIRPAGLQRQPPEPDASPLGPADGATVPRRDPLNPAIVRSPDTPPGWERIYEGTFVEAVLVNQLNGDFPGPVLAAVAVPHYSADRQRIVIPRGSRVVGSASAVGGRDQARLAVGFHRLIFPDGRWVSLEFAGLNQIGEGALKDQVNRHYFSMFASVGAVGIISGLTLRGSNPYAGGGEGFRAGAGQGLAQSATTILDRFLNRLPTITIRAGHRLRIWLTSDVLVPRPA